MQNFHVTTFYRFMRLSNLDGIKSDLTKKAGEFNLSGLVILGEEGINATVAAPSLDDMEAFQNWVRTYFELPGLFFKNSYADNAPFRRFKIKIREEIVTLGTPELFPESPQNRHLSPDEWNQTLMNEDVLLIDTRNWYETNIGTFKGAVNPGIEQFSDFPQWMEQQNYSKDKKVLIFCTGGIRCERGILELERQGYKNVFQLNGGILKYMEEKPNDQFEGECFVFDHRVALDQELCPSKKYKLCPHCGQPAATKITCKYCHNEDGLICDDCSKKDWVSESCSKNCCHHHKQHRKRVRPFV